MRSPPQSETPSRWRAWRNWRCCRSQGARHDRSGEPRPRVWLHPDLAMPSFERLEGETDADVAVLGGGLVGITTALMLQGEWVAGGAHRSRPAGRRRVRSHHGQDLLAARVEVRLAAGHLRPEAVARTYGQANQGALEWMAERVRNGRIDCDFRRRAAYAYAPAGESTAEIEAEVHAAPAARGCPPSFERLGAAAVPGGRRRALRRPGRVPHPQVPGRARRAVHRRGRQGIRALARDAGRLGAPCLVRTPGGMAKAGLVVVATHYPFLDRSLAFARVHAQRSYAVLCRVRGPGRPKGCS